MMEKVMKIQTEERIFLGGAPKNIRDSFKQTMLMLGYSSANFAKNQRERQAQRMPKSKKGPRGLREDTVLDKMFRPSASNLASTFRAYDNDRHLFDIGDFEGLLGDETMLAKLAADPKHKILKEIWTNRKQMPPMQMLLALR